MFIQEIPPVPALPEAHSQPPQKMHQKAELILKCSQNLRKNKVICNPPPDYKGFIINIGSGFRALNLAQTFNLSVLI